MEKSKKERQKARDKKIDQWISRGTKAGMVGSIALTFYLASKGKKKPHTRAAKAFLFFAAAHTLRNIKYLLK